MKELSIEQKAKAYDRALKVLHKYDGANIMFSQSLKEEMFPELKESEDERIVKELLTFFRESIHGGHILTNKEYDSWIAWLEKQGEHSNFLSRIQIGDKVTRNEDGVLVNLSQLNRVAKKDENQGEKTKPIEDFDTEFEKQVSCLIAGSINKDYEYTKDFVKWAANGLLEYAKHELEKNSMGISEATKKELEDNLHKALEKETPESWNKFLDEQGEQKSFDNQFTPEQANILDKHIDKFIEKNHAWSKEDEKILNGVITNYESGYLPSVEKRDEIIEKLKSLKDRYTWKPSDEQMKALSAINVTGRISYVGQGQELINLFNDLKKLRGE